MGGWLVMPMRAPFARAPPISGQPKPPSTSIPTFSGAAFRAPYTVRLLAVLREQGYCSAVGVIALPNEGSIRAHEALGFRKVGIFKNVGYKAGDWRDTGWWQLELRRAANSAAERRARLHATGS